MRDRDAGSPSIVSRKTANYSRLVTSRLVRISLSSANHAFQLGHGTFWRHDRSYRDVRHPLDHYLSLKRLKSLGDAWDEATVWRGMRGFAEGIQSFSRVRYEDFLASPDVSLRIICNLLDVDFDPDWQSKWAKYTTITGDRIDPRRDRIVSTPRNPINKKTWNAFAANDDFFACLDLLGYPVPAPLRTSKHAKSPSKVGHAKSGAKNWDDAASDLRKAHDQDPHDRSVALRLAEALYWIGETNEALLVLRSIDLDSQEETEATNAVTANTSRDEQIEALTLLCSVLEKLDRKYETIELRRRIAELVPENHQNLFQLSNLLVGIGEVDEGLTFARHLLEIDRKHLSAATNFLLYTNYSARYSSAEIANEHFRLGMRFMERADDVRISRRPASDKIRIGYLSADFHTHPVGKLIVPMLEAHDRQRFHITAYHDGSKRDGITKNTRRAVQQFREICGLSNDRVLETIRKDRLDILFDLGGYTGGGNRLSVLARRAAPIQISFLGYPHTTGLPTMDYRITDRFADPPGLTERLYGEQLVWLDNAHLAWRPYDIATTVEATNYEAPLLGSFNNVAKISPIAIDAFAAILRRVPEARLMFKYGDRFSVPILRDRYRRLFSERGVLPHRLLFCNAAATLREHLQAMASVDLALDSFPYQGTMTSLECLSVGTPIVSRCGDYYAHRATSAMFMRMGFHELVASDSEEYVEIAVQLLQKPAMLRALRQTVCERFLSSELVDVAGFVKSLERELEVMVLSNARHPIRKW